MSKYTGVGDAIIALLQLGITMDEIEITMGISSRDGLKAIIQATATHKVHPEVTWERLPGLPLKRISFTVADSPLSLFRLSGITRSGFEILPASLCHKTFEYENVFRVPAGYIGPPTAR